MTITVREANSRDLPSLRALFLASRQRTFTWLAVDTFQLADFDTLTRDEKLLVAETAGSDIAGFISVWEPDHFIHHLHVAAGQQGRGIGRALLNALPGRPARSYQLKCLQRNESALAFYLHHGFMQIGTGVAEDGAYVLLEWPSKL
jgi:ribosomal protein S18 acetylase RimI-like enzyme